MSFMSPSLNNYDPARSFSYSVIPDTGDGPLSDMPSTVDSTGWSALPEEYLLQNMT